MLVETTSMIAHGQPAPQPKLALPKSHLAWVTFVLLLFCGCSVGQPRAVVTQEVRVVSRDTPLTTPMVASERSSPQKRGQRLADLVSGESDSTLGDVATSDAIENTENDVTLNNELPTIDTPVNQRRKWGPVRDTNPFIATASDDRELFGVDDSQDVFGHLPPSPEQDELLQYGLERAEDPIASFDESPLDWRTLDPALDVETTPIFTFRDDLHNFIPDIRDDFRSLFTWKNGLILGIGTGIALGLRENADGEVRAYTLNNEDRWEETSEVLRQFGEFKWQVPVIGGAYVWSLWKQEKYFHDFLCSTISGYTLTSVAAVSIKGITNTHRPSNEFQNGEYGFPSFHTASTFAIAANIETYYGWKAGLPAYVLAGLVGWSRIDQREHDLSDVVFGSILGYTIGKSVAVSRLERESQWSVAPWYESTHQAAGVTFELQY